jgi:ribosomal protein S18 acetylase RimI-like enzyme
MSATTDQWPRAIRLKDRSEVLVRPLEPDDAPELAAAIERLSPESRYRRFLSPIPRLPASHLRSLTDVDHHTREALVAFDPSSRRGLGVARWGLLADDPSAAEVAVGVADDKQRLGLASALLRLLLDRAQAEGLREARAATQGENRGALHLLERFGFRRTRSEGGVMEFALALDAAGRSPAVETDATTAKEP